MTRRHDSHRAHHTRRQLTAAALVLLASVGWARPVSAGEPILSLAIDPDTPTTVYAGAYCSGVLKSLDRGDRWSNAGFTNTGRAVRALAIDPTTPATLYAGTDDGVFKSRNGGGSWQATDLVNTGVSAVVIDPVTPSTLYAASGGVIFKSLNRGNSWSEINPGLAGDVNALAIDPVTPATLYAGTYNGVFRSVNGGRTWSEVSTGLTVTDVRVLAIDPVTPARSGLRRDDRRRRVRGRAGQRLRGRLQRRRRGHCR